MRIHRAEERGRADHGWLQSAHTFSFGGWYDPTRMGFRTLRVINDDRVAPGYGFGTHGHRDMEIVSWVLEGALAHRDSLGHGSTIRPGQIQRMTAGTGVMHSETNPSPTEAVHFLQIWILPERSGLTPGYEELSLAPERLRGRLATVAAPDGGEGAVVVHQDARILAGRFDGDERAVHVVAPGRGAWVHVARGALTVAGHALRDGDALEVDGPAELVLEAGRDAEVLLFDLA